jgi:glycosyltransferase involved in cell wall biosynthesis
MASPTVSVVIPTRDRAQYIGEAIESVLVQTYPDYEIVVVDDGSTDNTHEILTPYIKNRFLRYERQDPRGVSAARNRGVRIARGRFIAFLDSDDLFLPTKLEKQMALFAQDPELGFVHCNFSKFDDRGSDLGVRDTSRHQGRIYPQILQEWSVLMAMPCMLVRKDVFETVGGFDEQMNWAEDMDLWRRIAKNYRVGTVPEALVKVRVHSGSTTFGKVGAADGFKRYLDKAFTDGPALGSAFRRRAYAKMYAKLAQNLLGEGGPAQMYTVRDHSLKALANWPLQLSAVLSIFASLLPAGVRRSLVNFSRKRRYPAVEIESL